MPTSSCLGTSCLFMRCGKAGCEPSDFPLVWASEVRDPEVQSQGQGHHQLPYLLPLTSILSFNNPLVQSWEIGIQGGEGEEVDVLCYLLSCPLLVAHVGFVCLFILFIVLAHLMLNSQVMLHNTGALESTLASNSSNPK